MKNEIRASDGIKKADLLRCHNFSEAQLDQTGLDWGVLEAIYHRHVEMTSELQTTASYIAQRLQLLPAVHSLKVRVKNPQHLIAKIIRKKLEQPALDFDISSYEARVTDLIGIRALHLFKNEWRTIHKFVTETWDLCEKPIAYVRTGDAAELIQDFEKADFDVKNHPFGYRSIHYVLKSQPAKCVQLAELQVRTIFEEGWSEIDHRVRYPRQSNNPYLELTQKQLLTQSRT